MEQKKLTIIAALRRANKNKMQQNQLTPSLLKQHYYSKYINTYTVLIVLIAIFIGFFVVDRYGDFAHKTSVISYIETSVNELRAEKDVMSSDEAEINKSYTEQMAEVDSALAAVFPSSENYTEIVKEFDKFFKKIHSIANEAVVTSIKFDNVAKSKNGGSDILPFTVNLTVTKKNFDEFLKYVYESGDLKNKSRLFEIKSFSLSIPPEKSGRALTLTLKMESYLRGK